MVSLRWRIMGAWKILTSNGYSLFTAGDGGFGHISRMEGDIYDMTTLKNAMISVSNDLDGMITEKAAEMGELRALQELNEVINKKLRVTKADS